MNGRSLGGSASSLAVRETSMDVGSVSTNNATSNAIEGLKKAQSTIDNAAQNIAGGSQDPQDIVALSQAATQFKANAAVIKTENETTKSLLDITA
jgi:poly-gamma-glutamate capsule biosynthesis protein CapA/YwtB (metallophosphatase superfamily)